MAHFLALVTAGENLAARLLTVSDRICASCPDAAQFGEKRLAARTALNDVRT